jgi:hypothetical protein
MKVYSMIYLMVLITYHKYSYFVKYIWSNLKLLIFLESENDSFLSTEEYSSAFWMKRELYQIQRKCNILELDQFDKLELMFLVE